MAPAGATTGSRENRRVPRGLRPGGEFDRYLAHLAGQDRFSGVVLLAYRDRPVLLRAYGLTDRARSVPNHASTRFNIASVTKSLTGIAVMRLVEQRKVKLNGKLGDYLDGFAPEVANAVTVHHLLTHTSGMGGYSRTDAFAQGVQRWTSEAEVMDGILGIIRATESKAADPGIEHRYSDSGYAVLGAIVAAMSKGSYYDYVHEHVMAAAGMTRSGFFPKPKVLAADDIAHPHTTDRETGARIDFTTSPYFGYLGGPADAAYATAEDLLRFAVAVRDTDTLLSRAFATLTTGAKVPVPADTAPPAWAEHQFYGYGFRAAIAGGHRLFGHSGTGAGNRSNLDIFPDLGWVTVTLGNYLDPITDVVRLQRQLITQP
ncbi:serine hydrolase domain-containing protein [Nonomuraea candida]|uniref:serine hydrolase domain-containing protein n=1 Tax=Nonomuraea candida TaxID=359159 RepID=UPI000694E7E4|nr:serine hydrolase domain-containing protein [Nonomuraea candida]